MIKQFAVLLLVAGFIMLLTGCPYSGHKFEEGRFPADPVNFQAVNSIYDDYNSTAPFIESKQYLYFSTNRNSNGGNFDIVGSNLRIYWDKDDGKLTIDNRYDPWSDYYYTDSLFKLVNTSSDEFGPYSLPYQLYLTNFYIYTDIIIFSNDIEGNQDLKFAWFRGEGENPVPAIGEFSGPQPVSFLNSEYNDAYLSFYGPGFEISESYARDPSLINELLFCSDRNGNFDIYRADVPQDSSLVSFLSGSAGTIITPVSTLNSSGDDKCPFVNGELLVFASDRQGGYGGFDLYYSIRNGNAWSDPVNFGEKINTAYNEYRPIIISNYEFVNDMMLFSSDRTGGKGSYDLYYVGIPKMTK